MRLGEATARVSPAALSGILFAVSLLLTFPGRMEPDSVEQLGEAVSGRYLDWNPPVMAFVWSHLLAVYNNPGVLLVLHLGLFWSGLALIADACWRAGWRTQAWLISAAGVFPLCLHFNQMIIKDVGMAAALVFAYGAVGWHVLQGRALPRPALAVSILALIYATLLRTNAAFAIGPLIALYFFRGRHTRGWIVVAVSIGAAGLALPTSAYVNQHIIGAQHQDAMQSLQLFDLFGIEARSRDPGVLGAVGVTLKQVDDCYSSYFWDTLSPWGICEGLRNNLAPLLDSAPHLAARSTLWRDAILSHPVAYARHRLGHFNSSMFFWVPAFHFRFSKHLELLRPDHPRLVTLREIRNDFFKTNVLIWPAMWFAGGIGLLIVLRGSTDRPTTPFAESLVISGLLYSSAYLLIGVATDIRYHYWSMVAILLAVLLSMTELRRSTSTAPSWRFGTGAALLALVMVLGYIARFLDVGFT